MGDQSDEADALQWAAGLPGVHEEPGPLSIGEERDESANFSPVPAEILNRDWSVIGRHKWKRQQSMPILEGRATLFAVKHFLRKVSNHHRKHLIFSDSMSAICAIDRGRGKTHGLRRVHNKSERCFWLLVAQYQSAGWHQSSTRPMGHLGVPFLLLVRQCL